MNQNPMEIFQKEAPQVAAAFYYILVSMAEVTKDIIIKKLRQLSDLNNSLNKRSNVISIDSLALCLHTQTSTLITLLESLYYEGKISYTRATSPSDSYTVKHNHGQVCLL